MVNEKGKWRGVFHGYVNLKIGIYFFTRNKKTIHSTYGETRATYDPCFTTEIMDLS